MKIVEISGINRDHDRVEIVLRNENERLIIGRVRPLSEIPNLESEFRIFVNQDEMDTKAKRRLEALQRVGTEVEFGIESFSIRGKITQLTEGLGGGAYNGLNIPQNPTLMIVTEPVVKVENISICEEMESCDANDSDLFWSGNDNDLMWSGDDSQLMWGNRKGKKHG